MIQYPVSFHAVAESDAGINTSWNIVSQDLPTRCAIPPEFEGPGGALSPEDLFAQALTNCFLATFKVYAEKSKLEFTSIIVNSELIVDLGEAKKPVMKKCVLHAKITGAVNPEKTKFIAEKAFQTGFILNSVKTETTLNLQVI